MIPGAREILPRIFGEKSGNDMPARRGGPWTGSRGSDNWPVFGLRWRATNDDDEHYVHAIALS
jgi:hypothetical protein